MLQTHDGLIQLIPPPSTKSPSATVSEKDNWKKNILNPLQSISIPILCILSKSHYSPGKTPLSKSTTKCDPSICKIYFHFLVTNPGGCGDVFAITSRPRWIMTSISITTPKPLGLCRSYPEHGIYFFSFLKIPRRGPDISHFLACSSTDDGDDGGGGFSPIGTGFSLTVGLRSRSLVYSTNQTKPS